MIKEAVDVDRPDDRNDDNGTNSDGSGDDDKVFEDHIESGEQGKLNGKEPGKAVVPLKNLSRDNAAKSWLFEKYYQMYFVDMNPEGAADDDPLEDEDQWEHRVITNVVWWRHKGYAVETRLRLRTGEVEQSIERYMINENLHRMIRASPYNECYMASHLDDS